MVAAARNLCVGTGAVLFACAGARGHSAPVDVPVLSVQPQASATSLPAGFPSAANGTDSRACSDTPERLAETNGANYLAVDDTRVYWSDSGGNIVSVPKTGGATSTLARARPGALGIALSQSDVFWIQLDSLRAVPKDGGAARTVASAIDSAYALAARGDALVVLDCGGPRKSIWQVAADGSDRTTLEVDPPGACAPSIAAGPRAVVFWRTRPSNLDYDLVALGDVATTLVSGEGPGVIAMDDGWAYFDSSHGLQRVPLSGGAASVVTTARAAALAMDVGRIYFEDPHGTLMTVRATGGAARTLVARTARDDPSMNAPSVVVDESCIYFTTDAGVMKLVK